MKRYSAERKQSVIEKMMPPMNTPISRLSEDTGISDVTLYHWRKQARARGLVVPGDGRNPEQWSAEDKFSVVLETASMNESELSAYCRKKGLYAEQIETWKQSCIDGNVNGVERERAVKAQTREDKRRIKSLERELRRKEKALAETAALLVLRKKAQAIWGEDEDA
jgi:transposase-like protein